MHKDSTILAIKWRPRNRRLNETHYIDKNPFAPKWPGYLPLSF